MKPLSVKSAWSLSQTPPPFSRRARGFPSCLPSDLFFRVRGPVAGDALAAADTTVSLGRAGTIRPGCAGSLSRRGLGPAFHASQRASTRSDAAAGAAVDGLRVFDHVGAPNHAGERDSVGASFISAGDPAVAEVAGRAGPRCRLVPARSAALLHPIHDG